MPKGNKKTNKEKKGTKSVGKTPKFKKGSTAIHSPTISPISYEDNSSDINNLNDDIETLQALYHGNELQKIEKSILHTFIETQLIRLFGKKDIKIKKLNAICNNSDTTEAYIKEVMPFLKEIQHEINIKQSERNRQDKQLIIGSLIALLSGAAVIAFSAYGHGGTKRKRTNKSKTKKNK